MLELEGCPGDFAAPRLRRPGRSLARWIATGAIGLVWFASAGCERDYQLKGSMLDPPREVPSFTFRLPSGTTVSTAPTPGHLMLVFFGYTHCPDICPTTLADWKRAKAKLGADGDRVRFIFVTVDPERDTPAVADRYAKQFDPSFIGVSGDSATTAGIMSAFRVRAVRELVTDSSTYFMGHSAYTFLVDSRGRIIAMYSMGMGWEILAADLKTLL